MHNTNLEKLWDAKIFCKAPHKGWYLHYFDNNLVRYGARLAPDDFLADFPGLNHIYLRLAWSYLEPEEGKFSWHIIDDVLEKWTARGYGAAFRITCKETSDNQRFATPEWVRDAGAKGTFIPDSGPDSFWEPDFGDPVFLDKLDKFHAAFAARYDSQPWMEYVDIGSYGSWGEGHNYRGSERDWPVDAIKKHIDIHCAHYHKTPIMLNDDFIGSRVADDGSRDEILRYAIARGLGMRDDSACVKSFADAFGLSTLRNPEFFEHVWRMHPVDIELEHYANALKSNAYRGGGPLTKAVEEAHATFVGFHGYAREWLNDNQDLAVSLGNRAGYWYFLKSIESPDTVRRGKQNRIRLRWENHGVAPAYHRFFLRCKLSGQDNSFEQILTESDNRTWVPGSIIEETLSLCPGTGLSPGTYTLGVRLYEERAGKQIPVEMGFQQSIRDSNGFYAIIAVTVI